MKHEVEQFVGQKGTVTLQGLIINIRILDVKRSYGRTRYLVTPLSGIGEIWTERVTLV